MPSFVPSPEARAVEAHQAELRRLGYSDREARFLHLVARQGGYFLRRQFCEFAGVVKGRADVDFTRRLLDQRHATVQTFCHTTQVFHLASRDIYGDLLGGMPSARRRRPALAIKSRLMAVDVALARPAVQFLSTERERLQLCDALGISRSCLPIRHYHPCGAGRAVTRYLADTSLIGAEAAQTSVPIMVLVHIDDGARSSTSFGTFLRRHTPLLTQSLRWKLVAACESPRQADAARRVFRQAFGDEQAAQQGRLRADLREYCELRQLYDAREWTQLTTARLERYFDLKQTLAGAGDAVFTAWQDQGERAVARAAEETRVVFPERFETLVLPHSYAAVEGVRGLR